MCLRRSSQLLILQHLVGMGPPLFAQIAYFFRDRTFTEVELLPARFNHASPGLRRVGAIASLAATAYGGGHGSTWPGNSRSPKMRPRLVAPDGRPRHALEERTTSSSCR